MKTGMQAYSQFYFEKGYNGLPLHDWLDNNPYVKGSKKKVVEDYDEFELF